MRYSALKPHLLVAPFGLLLGFALSRMGFTNFKEVNRMLTLTSFRLTLTFMLAVVFTAIGFLLLDRSQFGVQKPIHKGIVPGSILFGLGWALTGTCPAVIVSQIGEGYLPALVTLAGLAIGMISYRKLHARYFNWDPGSCES
jgi:uncharacterized protein